MPNAQRLLSTLCCALFSWIALGSLPWAPADWADANPGINIIQRVGARHGIIAKNVHLRTSFAVRLNETAIRGVVICPLLAIYVV